MKPARLFLLMMVICGSGISAHAKTPQRQAFISTEKAFIWDRPGFSYNDCRALDSNTKYSSGKDEALTMMRFTNGGKDACDNRLALLDAGDEVSIDSTEDGFPKFEIQDVLIGGALMRKKFFRAQAKDKHGKSVEGWISEDQLSRFSQDKILIPETLEVERPEIEPDCPPMAAKETNTPKNVHQKVQKFQKELINKIELGPQKNNAEIDRFMCLYRDHAINSSSFKPLLDKFSKAAKDAETNFKVPYALTMCTMLTESGLHFNPNEKDEYTGYGQFGSALVEDLSRKIAQSPYQKMWQNFRRENPGAEFTDHAIRSSANPASSTAAVAMALRWLFGERFKDVGCRDCSTASLQNMNRKDLYMLVAGYNYSPYSLGKLQGRSPANLQTRFPPPLETRNYMTQMDRCLSKGQETQFRVSSRHSQTSPEYKSRLSECNRTYPAK